MNVRPAFISFIQQSAGVSQPQISQIAEPANSDAETYSPSVMEKVGNYYGKVAAGASPQELESDKAALGPALEEHPTVMDVLANISDKACPETLPTGYLAGPETGIYGVDVSQPNIFGGGSNPFGDKLGTLFIDTTPGKEGFQYSFQPKEA